MSGENELKPREWWLGYVTENGVVVMNTPPEELSVHFKRVHHVREVAATPPASEIVPEGTAPRNPNLLMYEYEMDLRLAAKALEDSMPNTAERVRWLAGLMAKTRPQKET